jgi:hypothetical protein
MMDLVAHSCTCTRFAAIGDSFDAAVAVQLPAVVVAAAAAAAAAAADTTRIRRQVSCVRCLTVAALVAQQ